MPNRDRPIRAWLPCAGGWALITDTDPDGVHTAVCRRCSFTFVTVTDDPWVPPHEVRLDNDGVTVRFRTTRPVEDTAPL